jgi:hypothetical protein
MKTKEFGICKLLRQHNNMLMRFGGIIAVYCQNLKKSYNTLCGEIGKIINAKAGGI